MCYCNEGTAMSCYGLLQILNEIWTQSGEIKKNQKIFTLEKSNKFGVLL